MPVLASIVIIVHCEPLLIMYLFHIIMWNKYIKKQQFIHNVNSNRSKTAEIIKR